MKLNAKMEELLSSDSAWPLVGLQSQKQHIESALRNLIDLRIPSTILVFGLPKTGKTHLIRKVISDLAQNQAKEESKPQVVLADGQSDSALAVTQLLTGDSGSCAFVQYQNLFKNMKRPLLLVLENFQLFDKDFLYKISNSVHDGVPLMLLLTTRDCGAEANLDLRVRSRLQIEKLTTCLDLPLSSHLSIKTGPKPGAESVRGRKQLIMRAVCEQYLQELIGFMNYHEIAFQTANLQVKFEVQTGLENSFFNFMKEFVEKQHMQTLKKIWGRKDFVVETCCRLNSLMPLKEFVVDLLLLNCKFQNNPISKEAQHCLEIIIAHKPTHQQLQTYISQIPNKQQIFKMLALGAIDELLYVGYVQKKGNQYVSLISQKELEIISNLKKK